MHRLPKAAAPIAVMGIVAVLLAPGATLARDTSHGSPPSDRPFSPDAAELARHDPDAIRNGTTNEQCTGWQSTFAPPTTIRVLRHMGQPDEHVDIVPFRQYVLTVIPPEWGSANPPAIEEIGALAVKQYGWYYTIVYRGGVWTDPNDPKHTECYDVEDDTTDQLYQPESNPRITSQVIRATGVTWRMSLRKYRKPEGTSEMMLTGYRRCPAAGCVKHGTCGIDSDGFHLFQATLYKCVKIDGLDFEQTLRKYLDPKLEIVSPGAHNVIGTRQGDGSVLAPSDTGALQPRVFVAGPGSMTSTADEGISIAKAGWLGSASADMNGDGYDDLVTLTTSGGSNVVVTTALSDQLGGYGTAMTWWSGDIGVPAKHAQLFVADFTGDLRPDVGMLVNGPGGPGAPKTELLVLAQDEGGAAPQAPTLTWSGVMALGTANRFLAGDVNGDGAADLLVIRSYQFPETGIGTRIFVAASALPAPTFGPFKIWFDLPDVKPTALVAAMGDFNRDGRDDLAIAYTASDGTTHVDAVRRWRKLVERIPLWSSASSVPISGLKLGSADANLDGASDLVFYQNRGPFGTSVTLYHGAYTSLTRAVSVTDATLKWSSAKPY